MNRRRNIVTAGLVVLAFWVGASQALAQRRGWGECSSNPVLYSNDGFGGRSLSINRDVPNLHQLGMGDDASSVCVPSGWTVVLYRDSNYRGSALELRGPTEIYDLKRDRPRGGDWGDAISSVRVSRSRGGGWWGGGRGSGRGNGYIDCRVPELFGDDDFDGRSVTINNSIPDLHRLGMGDSASSICVPSGWFVVVYEDTGYRGRSLEIRGPESIADLRRQRPGGADWGDRISSVEVFRRGGRRR